MAVIGLDNDDVLEDFMSGFALWHNINYGTLLRYEDFISFDFREVLNVSKKEVYKRVMEFYKSPEFENLQPLKGSMVYVPALAKRHELHVITSRHDDLEERTLSGLNKYYPNCFTGVHLTNHWFGNVRRTKSEVCKEYGIQVLVDDHCTFAAEAADNGVRVIMPDRPWNQDLKNNGVMRVGSEWCHIYLAIENLAQDLNR
ncbi:hypothetical protein GOV10_02545 [Candidatus Woesearchaeota archaeon]|nr:hypothetical protein [Candidatus Woesearchaeota archaeon]